MPLQLDQPIVVPSEDCNDALTDAKTNANTPDEFALSSGQKRLRDEPPGYRFFWFPLRKRQRRSEVEPLFMESQQQLSDSVNSSSEHRPMSFWNFTSPLTYNSAKRERRLSSSSQTVTPPASRKDTNTIDNPLAHLQRSKGAASETWSENQSQLSLSAVIKLSNRRLNHSDYDDDMEPIRSSQRTSRLLKVALPLIIVLGLFTLAVRVALPLTIPVFYGREASTNITFEITQCLFDSYTSSAAGDQDINNISSRTRLEYCQKQEKQKRFRKRDRRQLGRVAVSPGVALFEWIHRCCSLSLLRNFLSPAYRTVMAWSYWLLRCANACLDAVKSSTWITIQILLSYPFQSITALLILMVARVYNLVVAKRFEEILEESQSYFI